jgi:hypothetical protein
MAPQLRRAAAAAREALVGRAAERWEANRADLRVADGAVSHPETGQALAFAALVADAPLTDAILDGQSTTPPEAWVVTGTSAPKVGARALATGAHKYATCATTPRTRTSRRAGAARRTSSGRSRTAWQPPRTCMPRRTPPTHRSSRARRSPGGRTAS